MWGVQQSSFRILGRLKFGNTKVYFGTAASFFLLLFLTVQPTGAQVGAVVGAIGGSVLVDEAGDELRETVDHARAAASALLGQADDIAKRRLEQIDGILEETVGGLIGKSEDAALAILAQANKDILALEKEILSDVARVIWEVECAGRRVVIEDVGTALGGLGEVLGTNQIRLTPPKRVLETPSWFQGCLWWCEDPYLVEITEPFGQTYIQVRDLMEGAIAAEHISDDTPAHQIVGTYEYLSSFAKKTSCFYQGSEDRYNREYVNYREKARKWNDLVRVRLQ